MLPRRYRLDKPTNLMHPPVRIEKGALFFLESDYDTQNARRLLYYIDPGTKVKYPLTLYTYTKLFEGSVSA